MNEELDINILETTFNSETFETAVSKREKHYCIFKTKGIFYYLKNNCFPDSTLSHKFEERIAHLGKKTIIDHAFRLTHQQG